MNTQNDNISKAVIEQRLREYPFSTDITVLDTVDSTNTYAKNLAQNGAPSGACVIAKTQTGGRGRLGRSFFSPSDTGIYMSIIARPEDNHKKPLPYTIIACVAVCHALEKFSDKAFGIKWVNDLFSDGKKVCGILTEGGTTVGGTQPDYYIVGIGINLSAPANGFPEEIKNIAGAVSNIHVSKNEIISSIVSDFFDLCENSSVEYIIREYKSRSFILGKQVDYIKDGKALSGIAEDINLDGNLIVRKPDGKTDTLISGEVSLGSESFSL